MQYYHKGMASLSDARLKGRFLVNNILIFGSACLVMGQNQFSIIKKQTVDAKNTHKSPQ